MKEVISSTISADEGQKHVNFTSISSCAVRELNDTPHPHLNLICHHWYTDVFFSILDVVIISSSAVRVVLRGVDVCSTLL